MPKEIRPRAFSSHAVPRSRLSRNLLSLTRAPPSLAVHGEGASLLPFLGSGCPGHGVKLLLLVCSPSHEAQGRAREMCWHWHCQLHPGFPVMCPLAEAGSCLLQAGPGVSCQQVLLLHPSSQGWPSPQCQLQSLICLCLWLFY